MVWFAFVAQIVIMERLGGSTAMMRSKELGTGYGGRIFGVYFLLYLVVGAVSFAVGLLLSLVFPDVESVRGEGPLNVTFTFNYTNHIIQKLVVALFLPLATGFMQVCLTLLYFDLASARKASIWRLQPASRPGVATLRRFCAARRGPARTMVKHARGWKGASGPHWSPPCCRPARLHPARRPLIPTRRTSTAGFRKSLSGRSLAAGCSGRPGWNARWRLRGLAGDAEGDGSAAVLAVPLAVPPGPARGGCPARRQSPAGVLCRHSRGAGEAERAKRGQPSRDTALRHCDGPLAGNTPKPSASCSCRSSSASTRAAGCSSDAAAPTASTCNSSPTGRTPARICAYSLTHLTSTGTGSVPPTSASIFAVWRRMRP